MALAEASRRRGRVPSSLECRWAGTDTESSTRDFRRFWLGLLLAVGCGDAAAGGGQSKGSTADSEVDSTSASSTAVGTDASSATHQGSTTNDGPTADDGAASTSELTTTTDTQMQEVDLDNHDSLVLAGEPVAIVDGDGAGICLVSTTGTPDLDPPIAVVEIDNDLQPDLVGASGNDFVMHAGDGKAFDAQVVLGELSGIRDLGFGDFDGNGRSDVVACDDAGLFVTYREDDE
jgi:hypothetical protein